jgi:uncharacterized membrane protein YiaA
VPSDAGIDFSDTAMLEYLALVEGEYVLECNRKVNFETRTGLVITALVAVCAFLLDKISLVTCFKQVLSISGIAVHALGLVGIGFYFAVVVSLFFSIKTIAVRKTMKYNLNEIDGEALYKCRDEAVTKIIAIYMLGINDQSKLNEHRAITFTCSLWSFFVAFVCAIIYISASYT